MAYASAADLIARIDTQIVGDLITDDDTDTGLRERPSQATILDSTVLNTALGDASGLIDAALQNKGLYTPDQLAALTGNALSHLKRITCIVAIAMLFDRRPTRGTLDIADRYREQSRRATFCRLDDVQPSVTHVGTDAHHGQLDARCFSSRCSVQESLR